VTHLISRKRSAKSQLHIVVFFGAEMSVVFVSAWLGFSFLSTIANTLCLGASYFGYCYLAANCRSIEKKSFRIVSLIVLSIPVAIGYLLSTFGFLGLAFIIADYTAHPSTVVNLPNNMVCRVTPWGMVAGDSGYAVNVYKRWTMIPFLQRRVASISVNEVNQNSAPRSANCDDALSSIP
jgi:hypothetical protein